ncbi:Uncharacterized protein OBRU01_10204, partial [Operophtera brumata]
MGPSGAGKTTLLNILAGYLTRGAKGEIAVNGVCACASQSTGRGGARYIRQHDDLRAHLTVYEAMSLAAALKLADFTSQERKEKTLCRDLSGGQRRRLAVALELLSDPSLMFLDEPTTGLDSSASASLISLLNNLARGGRTLVATIHQPSALLFEKIDSVYALADGRTLYNGPREYLIPALSSAGLRYNDRTEIQTTPDELETAEEQHKTHVQTFWTPAADGVGNEAGSVLGNYVYLYGSMLLVVYTGKMSVTLSSGSVLGNYVYLYGSMLLVVYTGKMSMTLSFPMEMDILRGEYFNRWYNLGPYIFSILAVELPFQVISCVSYVVLSYWLTDNPLEPTRATLFLATVVATSMCAQAWGYFIGSTTPT